MKIAIEAMGIHYFGGGRTATINLLKALFELDQSNKYLLFLNRPEPDLQAPNVEQKIVPIRNRFVARIWAQVQLPWLLRSYDLVHFVKDLGILGAPTNMIVTVFDMATLIYPQLYPRLDVWYWKNIQRLMLQRASQIIAISRQTAGDLQQYYQLPAEKISVIYPAVDKRFKPATATQVTQIRERYQLPANYLLHVGRLDPKKNIPMLIEAFALFRQATDFPGTLVLVGEPYRKRPDRSIPDAIEHFRLQDSVQLLGTIKDEELPVVYSGATIAISPSHYEGFGLAALEAMSCGSPLIANKAGAITEVVGNAAAIMSESTSGNLAEMLGLLWQDEARRGKMREYGLERAKVFNWEESARQTLNLYQRFAS